MTTAAHQVSALPQVTKKIASRGLAIGKQKVGFEATVRLPVHRFSSFKIRKSVHVAQQLSVSSDSPSTMAESRRTERAQAHANDREIEKMHERTLAGLAGHFMTGLMSRYQARVDELAWRRAANRGRSNPARERVVAAVFVIAIVLTGYRLVLTQQHLDTRQSELESAKQAADQAKVKAMELAKRAASLNSELEKTKAQRNELESKMEQATSEITSAQSELEDQ